jgi:hypothetical protein
MMGTIAGGVDVLLEACLFHRFLGACSLVMVTAGPKVVVQVAQAFTTPQGLVSVLMTLVECGAILCHGATVFRNCW